MDKMIHSNEFRLRVLLTNECNKNCKFCLNDFQKKTPVEYADPFDLNDCIRAYGQFMNFVGERSIITFSGGEPGLHPLLEMFLANARTKCDVVKVVTNGTAFSNHLNLYVDKWHIGVTDANSKILKIPHDKLVIQIVVTRQMDKDELKNLVQFYRDCGDFPIKLFADFHEKDRRSIYDKIEYVKKFYDIDTRWTGKQINRGPACEGCEKDCVTLKALWYFPDGSSSTCPQGFKRTYDDDSWDETMEKAYEAHRIVAN